MLDIGLICLMLAVALIVAAEVGYRVRAAFPPPGDAQHAQATSMMMSATLALMTLLTAFTFNLANSRYDLRRSLVVAEAHAISTAFLRQQLLAPAEQSRLAPLMRSYVAVRRAVLTDNLADPAFAAAQQRTSILQAQIWSVTAEAMRTPEGKQFATPLLQATNEMFGVAETRRAAIEARIPLRQIRVMITLAIGTAAMIGAALASLGARQFFASSFMFVLFALAFSLIHDLDTSNSGGIRTPSADLDRVAQQIAESQSRAGSGPPGELLGGPPGVAH